MTRIGSKILLAVATLGSLVGTSGCELQKCETDEGESAVCLKSLKRYEGIDLPADPVTYSAGMDLRVDGIYGDIRVVEGMAGEVAAVIEPFNYRAHDAEDQARDELDNNFDSSVEVSGNEIIVTTGRHDATNGLGADITVWLPPEFDGAIVLSNDSDGPINPGDVTADFVGAAWSVDVSTDSLGDCGVSAGNSVVTTRAHCDGEIVATGISDHVDIASTGLSGDIRVSLRSVAGQDAGGSITSEDGTIEVEFPTSANFSVQAMATDDGAVNATSLDDACEASVAAESSKSYTCGAGGPNFVVTAGTDGVGPSTVELNLAP